SVCARDLERRNAYVGAQPRRARQLAQERQQQTAGPGSDIEDAQRRCVPSLQPHQLEGRLDQRLAVGPRIEGCRRDGKVAAVEVAGPEDARYRLAGKTPGETAAEPLALLGAQLPFRLAQDLDV